MGYSYKVYNTQFKPHRYVQDVCAGSPEQAIKKAGFDWVREQGGQIIKSRQGRGFTNSIISIYVPETVNSDTACSADFIMIRYF